jgi:HK97 family phage prohead protease
MERTNLDLPFEVKRVEPTGTFQGHASVFEVEDRMGDVVAPGAFRATLALHRRKGRLPAMLWQHDATEPIGAWTEMREDEIGLFVQGRLFVDDIPRARQALALLKANGLSGLSIGFRTVRREIDDRTGLRRLVEVELFEVSLVTFPALDVARVTGVKAAIDRGRLPSERAFERAVRALGLSRQQARCVVARGYKALAADRGGDSVEALLGSIERARRALAVDTTTETR